MTEYLFSSKLPLSFLDETGIWSSNMLGNDVYLPVSIMRDFMKVQSMLRSQIWSHNMLANYFQLPVVNPFSNHKHSIRLAATDSSPYLCRNHPSPISNGTNSDFPFSRASLKWSHCFKADLLQGSDSPSSSLTFAT